MRINISARHLDLTKPLADYIQKKVEKCQKFFDHIVWAQIIISIEKERQVAEMIIHAGKITFRAKAESIDLYAAIDLALEKMEKQLHKRKEILKDSHKSRISMVPEKSTKPSRKPKANTNRDMINETKRYNVKTLTIREAIDEMEAYGDTFYMFFNPQISEVSVIYKKSDNSYGLIEPKI